MAWVLVDVVFENRFFGQTTNNNSTIRNNWIGGGGARGEGGILGLLRNPKIPLSPRI